MAIPGLRKAVLGLLAGGAATAATTEDAEAIPLGPMASTFDRFAARGAARLRAEGAPPDTIWQETRTHFDRFGTPMQESPTDTVSWRPGAIDRLRAGFTLPAEAVLDYPEAYGAYDALRATRIRLSTPDDGLGPSSMRVMAPTGLKRPGSMLFRDDLDFSNEAQMGEHITHEMTHLGPQRLEQRPQGGGLEDVLQHHSGELFKTRDQRLVALRRQADNADLLAQLDGSPQSQREAEELRAALASTKRPTLGDMIGVYRRFDGEDEAFSAQARYRMSPEERRRTAPYRMTRTPRDRLIYNGGVPGFPVGSPPPLMNALSRRP